MGARLSRLVSSMVSDISPAAVTKLVTNPAKMPPIISGTSTRRRVRQRLAPKFSAASSSAGCICAIAAMQERSA